MTTMTIRISEEEKELIQGYAKIHGMSAAEVMRRSTIARIEDEFDLAELNEAIATSKGVFIPFSKIREEYGY